MSNSGDEFIASPRAQPIATKTGAYVAPANRTVQPKTFEANFPELCVNNNTIIPTTKPKLAWSAILTQTKVTSNQSSDANENISGKLRLVDISDKEMAPMDTNIGIVPKINSYLKAVEITRHNKSNMKYDHLFGPPSPEDSESEADIEEDSCEDYEQNTEEEDDYVDDD